MHSLIWNGPKYLGANFPFRIVDIATAVRVISLSHTQSPMLELPISMLSLIVLAVVILRQLEAEFGLFQKSVTFCQEIVN